MICEMRKNSKNSRLTIRKLVIQSMVYPKIAPRPWMVRNGTTESQKSRLLTHQIYPLLKCPAFHTGRNQIATWIHEKRRQALELARWR